MKLLLLPLDDRPVTFVYPQMVAQAAGVETVAPPRKLMGSLAQPADPVKLMEWLEQANASKPDALILALDSLLYGGLIPSRRSPLTLPEVLKRVDWLKSWHKRSDKKPAISCQASIMRISDNYDNTEEKEYWAKYGREIFAWSQEMHKLTKNREGDRTQLRTLEMRVPAEIRQDYQSTRFRNFQALKKSLELVRDKQIERMTLSLDDSGEFGLNLVEKQMLEKTAQDLGIAERVAVYAGADEVLCSLIARHLTAKQGAPKVALVYSNETMGEIFSRYEGQTIARTIESHLNACGVQVTGTYNTATAATAIDADFVLLVHLPDARQGDHVSLPGLPNLTNIESERSAENAIRFIEASHLPVAIADVAYANGSDPLLMEKLFAKPVLLKKLWSYAGWNTTGNAAGSAIALAVAYWYGRKNNANAELPLKRCLFVRFADDWGYQTQVRPKLQSALPGNELAAMLAPYVLRIGKCLDFTPGSISVRQPWNRTFEIEVSLTPQEATAGAF
jgi:hypothetical protein